MKQIRKYGHAALRKKAEEVTVFDASLHKLITQMRETLTASKGLGLAAPQVGVSKRIFLAVHPEIRKIHVLVNPRIEEVSGQDIDVEGCLSFPDVFFHIKRAARCVVTALNEKGKPVTIEGTGTFARCFQHEMDHLDGVLIIDYATEAEKKLHAGKLTALNTTHKK